MEILDSADVELDFGDFPATPVQLDIFITPSARVRQMFPFCNVENADLSFILRGEVLLPRRCVHRGLPQNSLKSKKKKNVMRGRFYLKTPVFP